ncbi:maleylpyruvate isomerase N-terminal domain-containing protein [Sinomonas sp. RB5]
MEPTAGILAGYRRACDRLEEFLAAADAEDLARRSGGTRWTNEQLLFHMVFGYMVVRALLPLVRVVSRLPVPARRAFAAALDAAAGPFDWVNYWGSCAAARVCGRVRMARKLRATTAALARSLRGGRTRSPCAAGGPSPGGGTPSSPAA